MKSVTIYRIEHKFRKTGPYRSEIYIDDIFSDHKTPNEWQMQDKTFNEFLKETPYYDDMSEPWFSHGRYPDYKFGMTSLPAFKHKFISENIADLINHDFCFIKIELVNPQPFCYFKFQDDQIMFIDSNLEREYLSFEILK